MPTEHHKGRRAPLVRKPESAETVTAQGAQIKKRFEAAGISVAAWAAARGFNTTLVYEVMGGKRQCKRGQSHRIAVALGLKSGSTEVATPEDFDPRQGANQ